MSTVIKAGEAGSVVKHLSTVDLADHLAEARSVVDAARHRAAQIIADAEVQAKRTIIEASETGYKGGREKGHSEGVEAGRIEAHDEAIERFEREQGHLVSALRGAVADINAIKEDLRIAAEKDLLDFAVMLAEKLTFAVGRLHRESAVENLRRALRLVESRRDVIIRVHPDDAESAEKFADDVLRQVDTSRVVGVVSDDSLSPGGCKVESGPTRVDATLETQVEEIVALLTGGEVSDG